MNQKTLNVQRSTLNAQLRFIVCLLIGCWTLDVGRSPAFCADKINILVPASYTGDAAITRTPLTLTPVSPLPRSYGTNIFSRQAISRTTDTNGLCTFSNILWGYYSLTIPGNPGTKFDLIVGTNLTGNVNVVTLITNGSTGVPPNPSSNYLTEAQSDARYVNSTNPLGTTYTFIPTNAGALLATNGATVFHNTNAVTFLTDYNTGTNALNSARIAGDAAKVNNLNGAATNLSLKSMLLVDESGSQTMTFFNDGGDVSLQNVTPPLLDGVTFTTGDIIANSFSGLGSGLNINTQSNNILAAVPNLSSVYRVANYGATNDCIRLDDVRATNTSAVVFSASAAFAAGDVGKVVMLYQDSTNRSFLRTTVASVQSASQATLSVASSATITGTLRYGTDNTIAISNTYMAAYNAGGGVVSFDRGQYLVSGGQVSDGYYDSVFKLPATFLRANATNRTIAVEFRGAFAPSLSYSSQSNGPAEAGTILYIASTNNTGQLVRPQALFAHNYPGDKALEQYTFRNLTFRQPVNPQLWGIYAKSGGGLNVDYCVFDTDFPRGYLANAGTGTSQHIPLSSVETTNYIGGIFTPEVANNSNTRIRNSMAFGLGVGFALGEHCRAENLNVQFCGTGFLLNGVGTHSGPNVYSAQLFCCRYPMASINTNTVAGESDENWVDLQNIEIESHGWIVGTIYDPGNNLRGRIRWNNDFGTNITSTQLEISDGTLLKETKTGRQLVSGIINSSAGIEAWKNGIIFDWPVMTNSADSANNVGKEFFSYGPLGDIGVFSLAGYPPLVESPDGLGVRFTDLTSYTFTKQPTGISGTKGAISTNITVDLLLRATNASIHYVVGMADVLFPPYTGGGQFLMYVANGTQIGWRTKNTNGTQVTVTADPPSGLADSVWHQMTGTYDAGTSNMILYVDGLPLATNTQTGPLIDPTAGLAFSGCSVAHPRIWNRTLSADEIANLAGSRKLDKLGRNNASSLTNLNASQLTSGSVPNERLLNNYTNTVLVNATNDNVTISGNITKTSAANLSITPSSGWPVVLNASDVRTGGGNSALLGIGRGINTGVGFQVTGAGSGYFSRFDGSGNLVTTPVGTITFSNIVSAATITATNGYYFASGTGITNTWLTNATLDFPSTSTGAIATLTINLTNASDGDFVTLAVPAAANSMIGAWSAIATNGYVLVNWIPTAVVQDPPSGNFRIKVEKVK